jgi:hypothetical protein
MTAGRAPAVLPVGPCADAWPNGTALLLPFPFLAFHADPRHSQLLLFSALGVGRTQRRRASSGGEAAVNPADWRAFAFISSKGCIGFAAS